MRLAHGPLYESRVHSSVLSSLGSYDRIAGEAGRGGSRKNVSRGSRLAGKNEGKRARRVTRAFRDANGVLIDRVFLRSIFVGRDRAAFLSTE